MKRLEYINLLFLVMLSACGDTTVQQDKNEQLTMNQLILLRTEGLIAAELTHQHTDKDEIQKMCQKIMAYYRDTHPGFLKICRGRTVAIRDKEFDYLWNKINSFLHNSSNNADIAFMSLSQENIMRSITLYETIIQHNDWEDISCFSFRALPDLYHQQRELGMLQSQLERSPE